MPETCYGERNQNYIKTELEKAARAGFTLLKRIHGMFDNPGNKKLKEVHKNEGGETAHKPCYMPFEVRLEQSGRIPGTPCT